MLPGTFSDFITDIEESDHRHTMIDNIGSKIESLHFQECSISWMYKRDYLYASVDILFCIMSLAR